MSTLKSFTEDSTLEDAIYCGTSTVIKISSDGNIEYFKSKNHKEWIIGEPLKNARLILAWGGKWSTDIFEITKNDIETFLKIK